MFGKGLVFLMQGLGVGYSPVVPGTFGTLLAIPLYLALAHLSFWLYSAVILILFIFGVYGCRLALAKLKVSDPPSLVWDEIVGFLVAMAAITPSLKTVLVGFLLFRLFDIVKPWPANWVDKNIGGGLGVMLDDVLAGIYVNLILQFALWMNFL